MMMSDPRAMDDLLARAEEAVRGTTVPEGRPEEAFGRILAPCMQSRERARLFRPRGGNLVDGPCGGPPPLRPRCSAISQPTGSPRRHVLSPKSRNNFATPKRSSTARQRTSPVRGSRLRCA